MAFQYVTVAMPWSEGQYEQAWTERLNSVAGQGWRLVTITAMPVKTYTYALATFEREVPNG